MLNGISVLWVGFSNATMHASWYLWLACGILRASRYGEYTVTLVSEEIRRLTVKERRCRRERWKINKDSLTLSSHRAASPDTTPCLHISTAHFSIPPVSNSYTKPDTETVLKSTDLIVDGRDSTRPCVLVVSLLVARKSWDSKKKKKDSLTAVRVTGPGSAGTSGHVHQLDIWAWMF